EEVDLDEGTSRIVHREHFHALFFHPHASRLGIREFACLDGGAGDHADPREGSDGLDRLTRRQVDDEVDVRGQARVAVEHDREPADDDVTRARLVQRREDGSEHGHAGDHSARFAGRDPGSPADDAGELVDGQVERVSERPEEQGSAERAHREKDTPVQHVAAAKRPHGQRGEAGPQERRGPPRERELGGERQLRRELAIHRAERRSDDEGRGEQRDARDDREARGQQIHRRQWLASAGAHPTMITFDWLGATTMPAGALALAPFCAVGLSMLTASLPSIFTLLTPALNVALSMLVPEETPFSVPASSPIVRGISLAFVITGWLRTFTFLLQVPPSACWHMPMFGKGVGIGGAGGAGTLHTSGNAKT